MNRDYIVNELSSVLTSLRELIADYKAEDQEIQLLIDSRGFIDLVYLEKSELYKKGDYCLISEDIANRIVRPE